MTIHTYIQSSSSNGCCLGRSPWTNEYAPLFSHTHYWYEVGTHVESIGVYCIQYTVRDMHRRETWSARKKMPIFEDAQLVLLAQTEGLLCSVAVPTQISKGLVPRIKRRGCHVVIPSILDFRLARTFQHSHFIPIVGVGKRGAYSLVHGDLPSQHSFGTTLRFTGPVRGSERDRYAIA